MREREGLVDVRLGYLDG